MAATDHLSCSSKFAKFVLFIFNAIIWLAGCVVLGTGIWIMNDPNATKLLHLATLDANGGLVKAAAIVLIVVGCIVFLTGFLGCCGAIRESACMLLTYASIVGFVLVLQIIAGIMIAALGNQISDQLGKSLNTTVQERYGKDILTSEGMVIMQRTFRCCGAINGPPEWKTSEWRKTSNHSVPDSCCVLSNPDKLFQDPEPVDRDICYQLGEDLSLNVTAADYINLEGCQPSLNKWIRDHSGIVIGVAFGLAAVQLIGVILACCLRTSIKSAYEYV